MPTYEYICGDCNNEIEVFQRMSEDPLTDCPQCSQPGLRRKIGLGAGIIFKGGGFYETDFKDRKGSKSESSPKSSSSPETGSKSESAKAEKPADTKPAPAATSAA